MEQLKAQKFEYFSQLLLCGQNLYLWEYDPDLQLINTSCPQSETIGSFLLLGGSQDYLRSAISGGAEKPLILSDDIGLSWIAAFEVAADSICRVFLIGPAFNSDVPHQKIDQKLSCGKYPPQFGRLFKEQIRMLPIIPLSAWFQFGLMLHYHVTGEKLSVSDFSYQAPVKEARSLNERITRPGSSVWFAEQMAMKMIEEGRLDYQGVFSGLSSFASALPHSERIETLREQKNAMISFISLATRAAIRGGLDVETAYHIGEVYIQSVEGTTTISELMHLNATMFEDFVHRVHQCRMSDGISPCVRAVCNQIERNLEKTFTVKELATSAGYTEYYFRKKFRDEMGLSIAQYTRKCKIEQAKLLLHATNDSIESISSTLGFCNPSYFTQAFRSIVGVTPNEYRLGDETHTSRSQIRPG